MGDWIPKVDEFNWDSFKLRARKSEIVTPPLPPGTAHLTFPTKSIHILTRPAGCLHSSPLLFMLGGIRHYGPQSHCHIHQITANDEMNSHPELVGPELVDVGSLSWYGLVPEAELQQKLVLARHQHLAPLFPVLCEVLPTEEKAID